MFKIQTLALAMFLTLSSQAKAHDCDPILNIVYVIEVVRGTYNPPRRVPKLIVDNIGWSFMSEEIIEGAPSQPTDIFSTNPNLHINFANLRDGTYTKVYLKGSRSDVLEHLMIIKTREAKNRRLDLADYLARENVDDIQKLVEQFPAADAASEVTGVLDLLEKVRSARADLAADKLLASHSSEVTVSLTILNTSPAVTVVQPRFRLPFTKRAPIQLTAFESLLNYLRRTSTEHKVSDDGKSVHIQFSGWYVLVISRLHEAIDFAYRERLISQQQPTFQYVLDQLNQAFPPNKYVRSIQEKYLKDAKENLSADPRY